MRQLDSVLSGYLERRIIRALNNKFNPSMADHLAKWFNCQFIEIQCIFQKVN